jgi:hypothetical protein
MTVHIMNSLIIPTVARGNEAPAVYHAHSLGVGVERARLAVSWGFRSAIGHASTAAAVSVLLGIDCPIERRQVHMEPGDKALVFRLQPGTRLPEGAVLDAAALAAIPHEWVLLYRAR